MSIASETLSAMVLQPNTSSASLSDSGRYTEVWKGPWSEIKKVTSTGTIFSKKFNIGQPRPDLSGTYWKSEYAVPQTLGTDWPWIIQSIDIEQMHSGEHGLLKVQYQTGVTPGAEPDPTDPEDVKEDESKRRWTLTWGAYKFPILNFISDPTLIQAILQYKNYPITNSDYRYYSDTTKTDISQLPTNPQQATQAGARQVADFFKNGVSPTYHYPIITYHQEYIVEKNEALNLDIGKDIDKITQLPNECKFKGHITPPPGKQAWQWMIVSDTGTYSEETIERTVPFGEDEQKTYYRYVRDTRWEGSIKYEPKFYGDTNTRWVVPS